MLVRNSPPAQSQSQSQSQSDPSAATATTTSFSDSTPSSTTSSIKLVDFGLANYWDSTGDPAVRSLRTQCGSPHYAAPEVLKGDGKYSGPLADIWSLGVLLYAMLCGSLPFNARSIPMLIKKILEGKFKLPKYLSPSAQHLIQTILQIVPENRPSLEQIQSHPFMQQYARDSIPSHALTDTSPASIPPTGIRPLSRPEIISPQSYVNAKGGLLPPQYHMPTAFAAGLKPSSRAQPASGYYTANANGSPSLRDDDGDDDDNDAGFDYNDDEDDDPDADSTAPYTSSAVTGAQSIRSSPAKSSAHSHSSQLPPSSALSFKPESAFLKMIADDKDASATTGEDDQLFATSASSRRAIPIVGTPQSNWSNGGLNIASSHSNTKPITCQTCGKQLRLHATDDGVLLLSTSISKATSASHLTSRLVHDTRELCTCSNDTRTQSTAVAPASRPTYSSETVDTPNHGSSSISTPQRNSAPPNAPLSSARKKPTSPLAASLSQAQHEAASKSRIDLFLRAAERGDVATVSQLVAPRSDASEVVVKHTLLPLDVRVTTSESWNGLHFGARHGHEQVVQFLLTCWQPLDINSRTSHGDTPLMLAAEHGHMNVVQLLLRYGAAIHVLNNDGKSAIFLAREGGYTQIAQALTAASSARSLKHQTGHNAVTVNGKDGERVKELNHEFFRAAECGDLAKVRHLLELNRSSSSVSSPSSPLPSPSPSPVPSVPVVSRRNAALTARSAEEESLSPPTPRFCVDIRARGIDNWSVLHFAARKGRTQVVEYLLDQPCPPDVNALTKNNWTPLMLAADRGHTETCRLLINKGADTNLKSNVSDTEKSVEPKDVQA